MKINQFKELQSLSPFYPFKSLVNIFNFDNSSKVQFGVTRKVHFPAPLFFATYSWQLFLITTGHSAPRKELTHHPSRTDYVSLDFVRAATVRSREICYTLGMALKRI